MIKWWNLSSTITNFLVQNLSQTQQVELPNNYLKQITQVFLSTPLRYALNHACWWSFRIPSNYDFSLLLCLGLWEGSTSTHNNSYVVCQGWHQGHQYLCSRMLHSFKVSQQKTPCQEFIFFSLPTWFPPPSQPLPIRTEIQYEHQHHA